MPRPGLLGAAIAVSCALMVVNVVRLIQVRMVLKIQPYSLDFLKPIAAATLSSLLLIMARRWLLPDGELLLQLGLGAIALAISYGAFLALMGIRPEEKLILQRIKQKLLGNKEKNKK
ncbi:MAG: polysaccharide biosynthesis C-terminal domain-containing protein [Clostridiales bacterium]|nr:polysaccharide biosynthesis C-terminal domain-containing protein [Clostridiales bacterium]